MTRRRNALDSARAELAGEVAAAALAVATLERRIHALKEESTLLGYDLLAARGSLRTKVSELEQHDQRRATQEERTR